MKTLLRHISLFVSLLFLTVLTGCDVHEWPEKDKLLPVHLRLQFDVSMGELDHYFTRRATRTVLSDRVTNRFLGDYDMRYLINAYPIDDEGNVSQEPVARFVFSKSVFSDYDFQTTEVSLPAGRYQLMAWADFVETSTVADKFYHPTDFNNIHLPDTHEGNSEYRDAFRGMKQIEVVADVYETEPLSVLIPMQRPLARFTFVTTDLKEFMEREMTRVTRNNRSLNEEADGAEAQSDDDSATTKNPDTKNPEKEEETINLEDYKVVFYYSGFMPSTYNMFIDKPIDSKTGVNFPSQLTKYSDTEATMGFDYVMVNGAESSVLLMVGLYSKEGELLSMSSEINVPLKRSHNTIVRGSFLLQEANGGVGIDPDFEGDYVIPIP